MRLLLLLSIISACKCFGQQNANNPDLLYEQFTKAYDELSADKLSSLYMANAEVLNLYDGDNSNSMKGQPAIKKYYEDFFSLFTPNNQKLLLTFKIVDRKKSGENILDNGFYRLEIVTPNKPSSFSYGKFSTVLEEQNGSWKFKTDATTNTEFVEYENAALKTIPEREELLDAEFYDDLLGDYMTDKNRLIVIGRSQVRLFAYFENTNEYRGLNKINATTWTAGKTIRSTDVIQTFKFKTDRIEIYENEKLVSTAKKVQLYQIQKVSYTNSKRVKLGGTLFIPKRPTGKAIVLTHGSGPQDRNGYASIIRLLADVFARDGITVLTYDKQGVGQSEGNSETASFTALAQDAISGIDYLKSRKDLLLSKIGLGGSSQAGWIIAKAIDQNSNKVDFALTIGAAGSGIAVADQNIYNTETTMRCSGSFSENQIATAITQQRYFFEYLADQSKANKLDEFTRTVEKDTAIRDWLFPTSSQVDLTNRNQWFTALEIHFSPLPIWKDYKKPVLMTFSEFDDSTSPTVVKSKVDNLKNKNIRTVLYSNAQHLGLETTSVCKGDISELTKFHKDFFKEMRAWLKSF